MIVKLLTEHHLEFLSLKGGCRGSSESTHVKMPQCWKFYATAIYNVHPLYIHFPGHGEVIIVRIVCNYNYINRTRPFPV